MKAVTIFVYLCIFWPWDQCHSLNTENNFNYEAGKLYNKSRTDDLVSVIVIYRHGDRTPIDTYPTDPYKNESFWPVGFGQLTNEGKRQHYTLGKWLRDRYDDFLPMNYSEKDIHVRSTDVDRTLMSAYSNLAGLYPPTKSELWNLNVSWQPIPVHTIPEKIDTVLAMKTPCNKYAYLVETLLATPKFVKIQDDTKQLYEYVTKHTGKLIDTLQNLEFLYNTFTIEEKFNYTLPEWTKSVYPDKMKPLASLSFAVACYTEELARLKVGPLMYQILKQLNKATELIESGKRSKRNTPYIERDHLAGPKKMYVYSGHDTTIANILNALGIFEYHSPPYASTILIELHSANVPFINIFYKNSTEGARLMKLPKCAVNCPLAEFEEILKPITVDANTWEDECDEIRMVKLMPFSTLQNVIIVGSCFILTLLLTSIIVSVFYSKQKDEQKKYYRLPDTEDCA